METVIMLDTLRVIPTFKLHIFVFNEDFHLLKSIKNINFSECDLSKTIKSDSVSHLIKIQPTIFNGLFAAVLLGGLLMRRAMMQVFFAKQFYLTDDTWYRLSRRWGWFFLCLAMVNELVWRNASDSDWVFYKTFIAAPASVLFMLAQLPLTLRGRLQPGKIDHG